MTRIIADTLCGLSLETARRLDIPMIPQVINFGEESYREGVDMDHGTFMARLRTGKELPKTSAPYPGDFLKVFEELAPTGESLVCLHPSAEVSGTVRSALTAQEAFPQADIRIVDTRTIAGPLASIVLAADRLAKAGAPADQVVAAVHAMMPLARIYFLVDTLEFLRRGGRIGGAAALVGSVLQIKPILTFTGGKVEPFEKERTKKRALARVLELVRSEAASGPEAAVSVMHSAAPDEAAAIAATLMTDLGLKDVLVMDLVPAIVTHAGPGTLAIGFFTTAGK